MLSHYARIMLATIFVGSTALAACSGTTGPSTKGEVTNAESKSEAHESNVPVIGLALRLDTLKLRPEQRKTIEAMEVDLEAKGAGVRKEGKALAIFRADGVDCGKVDQEAIDAQSAKVKTAMEAQKPVFLAAMQKLHDTLDMEQRKALVAGMHDHFMGMGKGKGKEKDGDHKESHWGHHGGGKHGMKGLLKDLNLTDEQKDAFHAAMKADHKEHKSEKGGFHEARAKMKEAAEAFVSDSFDANKFDLPNHAGGFAARMAKMVEVGIPILNADQRAILAKRLRAHADKMG